MPDPLAFGPPGRRPPRGRPAAAALVGLVALVGLAFSLAVVASGRGLPTSLPADATASASAVGSDSPSGPRLTTDLVRPSASASSPTTSGPTPFTTPMATSVPTPTPRSTAFAMDIYRPGTFVSQIDKEHCLPAALQNMLDIIGPTVDRSAAMQQRLMALAMANNTQSDSRDGGPGPSAWAATLHELGAGDYQVRVFDTRAAALRAAVLALEATGRPVGIMAWWGAHAWVLTGFVATADPASVSGATVTGYRIVDPFYPRRSTIWGQTLPPDSLRSPAEMIRNLPAWTRPEGRYPGRDGKWLMVLPVGELVPRLGPSGRRS